MATSVEGQVVWRRRFNAVFHFFDLRIVNDADAGEECSIRMLVSSGHLPKDVAKEMGNKLRCGDRVRVTGDLDPAKQLLNVTAMEVLSRWSEAHPSTPFQPQPRTRSAVLPAVAACPVGGESSPPSQMPLTKTACKFFVNTGRCANPDCDYLHDATTRGEWVAERRRQRRAVAQGEGERLGDPHAADSKAAASHRAAIFAEWLIDTYGVGLLSEGTGVLDVAGGRGDVSFELLCVRGIPCVLVDPRPQKLRKHQWKRLQQLARAGADGHERRPELPRQLQARVGPDFCGSDDTSEAAELVGSSSIFVGMHPDEATEWIVDTAIRQGRPFAVLPCCVFADAFERRTADGRPVTTYKAFVEFLMAKHESIQRAWLPFEGKNCVLYYRPSGVEPEQCVPCADM